MSSVTTWLVSDPQASRREVGDGIDARAWAGERLEHCEPGTAFLLVSEDACLTTPHGVYPLPARSFAVLPDPARVEAGSGVMVTHRTHRGLFHVGGPVEATGRLRYIDGCSDTVLVAPVVHGDPCLNLLHLPSDTVQTDHQHPSARVGLVVAGRGSCVVDRTRREPLQPGSAFVLPASVCHRFETEPEAGLLVMAWHPDSTSGPTDDDHPMLNRTLRPGSSARVR